MADDTTNIPDGVEYWQTHIVSDRDYRDHAEVEVDDPEPDWSRSGRSVDQRVLALTEGDIFELPDEDALFAYQNSPDGQHHRTLIPDPATAIGYFLYGIETHGGDLEPSVARLKQFAQEDDDDALERHLEAFMDRLENLTPKDRRLRLLDLLDYRIENGDWAAEPYYEAGATWRSTNLSESGERLAKRIERDLADQDLPHPRLCYASAGEAAIHEIDNHRVEYVEGIALPLQASQAIRHAWIEIDGEVCELTWPWHRYDGAEAVYFGVPISKEEVKEKRASRKWNGQIILDEDEVDAVGAAMAGEQRALRGPAGGSSAGGD